MLVTMPQRVATRTSRARGTRLGDQGNTLLIVAALDDEPPWALGPPTR